MPTAEAQEAPAAEVTRAGADTTRTKLYNPDGTYQYADKPGFIYYIGEDGQEHLSSVKGVETVNGESFVPEAAPPPVEQQVFPQPETWSQFPTAKPAANSRGYCGRCGWHGKP